LEPAFLVILESGIASRVAPHLEKFGDRLDPHLVETVEKGLRHSAVALLQAGYARTDMFRTLQQSFQRFDLIVSPTLTAPPLPLGDQLPDGPVLIEGAAPGSMRGGWYPYCFPLNLTGHPAISLPCGRTRGGLPIGLQIVARWHADRFLLAAADLVEGDLGVGEFKKAHD
jgi:aspartyl-tRNA(Asn)/glutamyl-tRNA(Gln) amidotransferase subunit A